MNASPQAPTDLQRAAARKLGIAWLGLCLALSVHTFDEASTGFLDVYNPTVVALRQRLGFWPLPTLELRDFLTIMTIVIVTMFALTPFAFRGSRWIRPLLFVVAMLMLLNGISHTVATILGRTVGTVHFPRPAPGFYSSPLLLIASIYALWQLRRTV